jgi:S-adenosylhomocysteine hydrolase
MDYRNLLELNFAQHDGRQIVDHQIASIKLQSMRGGVDTLTEAQFEYMNSYLEGT